MSNNDGYLAFPLVQLPAHETVELPFNMFYIDPQSDDGKAFYETHEEIHEPTVSSEKITSFERITLHISGMRFRSEYEIIMKGTQAEITQYSIRCSKDGDEKVPEKSQSEAKDITLS